MIYKNHEIIIELSVNVFDKSEQITTFADREREREREREEKKSKKVTCLSLRFQVSFMILHWGIRVNLPCCGADKHVDPANELCG